jgi:hypothetical protein
MEGLQGIGKENIEKSIELKKGMIGLHIYKSTFPF